MLEPRDRDAVARALSIDPASRWKSCAEFVASMQTVPAANTPPLLGSLDTTKLRPRLPRKTPSARTSFRFAIVAALVLLFLTVGFAMYYSAAAITGVLSGTASYKRGFGDTVVTYSDRNYQGAKWEKLTDKVIARTDEWKSACKTDPHRR